MRKFDPRLAFVWTLFAGWAGLIGCRLYDLQVVRHDDYRRRAERQQQRVVELDPPRGTIFDARGRELAVSVEVESAYAVPREIADPRATARALAGVLGVEAAKLERALGADREFAWLQRKLDRPVAARVRALGLAGVHFLPESKRYYPMRELGAQVLGYVGTDGHGLAGLEATYDAAVAGRPGRRTVLRDARRGTVLAPDLSFADAEPGEDLHLTIDAAFQHVVERELGRAAVQHRARAAWAVFVDPRSGAIRAMASWPPFDPNRFQAASDEARRNRPVQDAYEPGSTFKMVTAAAALEANVLDPGDGLDCEMGGIVLAGVRINDHAPFGWLTFGEVLTHSSNVGAIKIGLRAGQERLYRTLTDFGFGAASGVDLAGESAGIVRPAQRWAPLTKAYVSFGQGLSVTALQLANAFAAAGNGGELRRPFVVGRVGERRRDPALPIRRVASAATLRSLERMLESVVSAGTGKLAAVPGFTVAGKTGTAQKAVPGGYSPDGYIASFAGFVPARSPILAGVVILDEPRGGRYHGGDVAAPVFGAVAREALLAEGAVPERGEDERWPGERERRPEPQAADAVVLASTAPAPGGGPPGVPDFTGLSARQALYRGAALGLRASLTGSGYVTRQAPRAGTPITAGGKVELWLSSGAP
jgi:cell division protein FtsI (penicillin-binding protein 3)